MHYCCYRGIWILYEDSFYNSQDPTVQYFPGVRILKLNKVERNFLPEKLLMSSYLC
jgi:hypothetical protein